MSRKGGEEKRRGPIAGQMIKMKAHVLAGLSKKEKES
jgi:hypothetical protein